MLGNIDIAAIGYPAVREAFNDTLKLCVAKLSKSEIRLAQDVLDMGELADDARGVEEMLVDTALYSPKGKTVGRSSKRPIDRIAPKLAHLHDPLKSAIAARLPSAIFSIFMVEATQEPGTVGARDLLDNGRVLRVMDYALAAQVAEHGEWLIAGRFVDLGPWHIGFGIVVPLRKSEAVAISVAMIDEEGVEIGRKTLHEVIYASQLHGDNLVMAALEPLILALSVAVDAGMIDTAEFMAGFRSLFSADEGLAGKREAIA